mmetsp:Transcript_31514/g.45995  ORF Transcript_31514/g.45995 Transcript_31514/m.45995 type:complete len:380 (-) Transcript_31514:61-1200(-)
MTSQNNGVNANEQLSVMSLPIFSHPNHMSTATAKKFQNALVLPEETPNRALCRAIVEQNWQRARILLSYRGNKRLMEQHSMNQRSTALHMACGMDAPVDIFLSLVYIYADACLMQNDDGCTPLLFACKYASDEKILFLLKICPKAALIKDNVGDLPARYAIRYKRCLQVIESFLQIYPSSVTVPNKNGISALQEFFTKVFFDCRNERHAIGVSSLLLQASRQRNKFHLDASNQKRPWHILHASIIEPCVHWAFVVFFFEKHSYQIEEQDEDGNLPLHLLCLSEKSFNDKVFETFFKAYPLALSVKNKMGLTPLDVALLRQHIRKVECIVEPNRSIAHMENMIGNEENPHRDEELNQINTIFSLLLKDPSVVSLFQPNSC